jgi:hypothetical protein
MGPTIIFDKSAFQGLTVDESVWLDALYQCNITPLFYVETLADLTLQGRDRAPEAIVAGLARKTPDMSSTVNGHHSMLFRINLAGRHLPMDGRPVVPAMESALSDSGKWGYMLDVSPEDQAFKRWREGEFAEVERRYARRWRAELSAINLSAVYDKYRPIVKARGAVRTLEDVRRVAAELLNDPTPLGVPNAFWLAVSLIGLPVTRLGSLSQRWRNAGEPPLCDYAPYAAHVVLVDLIFNLAIGADLLGRERPSHKIDVSYLYYLPFCNVFASSDAVHRRLAPLLMREDQDFVDGAELKGDLRRLDEHFSALPDEQKARGVLVFAREPPRDAAFLTTRTWDRHWPTWRAHAPDRPAVQDSDEPGGKEQTAALMRDFNSIRAVVDQRVRVEPDEAAFLRVDRVISVQKGKWLQVQVSPPRAGGASRPDDEQQPAAPPPRKS